MKLFPSSVILKTLALTDDLAHVISTEDLPFYTCNFHVYTNSIKYGPGGSQEGVLNPGDIMWLDKGNLRDFMFKNYAAGANGLIIAIATVPNDYVNKNLGL